MLRFTPSRLLFTALVVTGLWLYFFFASHVMPKERGYDVLADPIDASPGKPCSAFLSGGMDDVTIVIKFGAPEVALRLPSYLETLLPCRPDLLLFSDRNDSIDGINIVDALANLRSEFRDGNPDFDLYDQMQRHSYVNSGKTSEGWRLDKYKFLPMMELVADLRPRSHWYVFVELDTYVNWDNLHRFLSRFDPIEAHYFGSPVWVKRKPVFAHGGSGYILSQGAMKKLVARGAMLATNHNLPGTHLFGEDVQKECCGDGVLANVLSDVGVKLEGYWPMFNGEKLSSLTFGREQWCEAVVTLHHLGVDDFDMMRRFESSRRFPEIPLTFRELFYYIEPSLIERMDDWSNLSGDVTLEKGSAAGLSFAACSIACVKDSKCVQYEHFGDTCRLSYNIRLGHKQLQEGIKKWTSGWMKESIESFRNAQPTCQEGAHIIHPNPKQKVTW